jgi:hypothetical protein
MERMLNLWELMVDNRRDKWRGPEIEEALRELGNHGHSGQEISIGAAERGWIIKIHSCFSDLDVQILIPENGNEPVEVLRDNRRKTERLDGC